MKSNHFKISIFFIIISLILLSYVSISNSVSATVQGSVYDIGLDKVKNVIVEINTKPMQKYVAKEGDYLFKSIPIGSYILKAYTQDKSLITTENITIDQEGSYTIDLFLIPEFGEAVTKTISWIYYLFSTILVILLLIVIYKRLKKPKTKEPVTKVEVKADLEKVIDIIKKENGRTTQKDIREKLVLSEAKVSLMMDELEDKGIIRKIKKGRGNIIILN